LYVDLLHAHWIVANGTWWNAHAKQKPISPKFGKIFRHPTTIPPPRTQPLFFILLLFYEFIAGTETKWSYTHTHILTHIYTYILTHTHTHTHTKTFLRQAFNDLWRRPPPTDGRYIIHERPHVRVVWSAPYTSGVAKLIFGRDLPRIIFQGKYILFIFSFQYFHR